MQFPGPFRAVVGLLANAAEEAKHLPDRAIELPMLAVSSALQASLRAQQRYARLAARGDEVLNRRPTTEEPPPWATFDEPVSIDELRRGGPSADEARAASDLLDEVLGVDPNGSSAAGTKAPANRAPAAPVKKAPARKVPGKKVPADRMTAGRTTSAKKAPAKRAADAGRAAGGNAGKTVSKPRHTAPSRFDAVGDEPDETLDD